ncbi:hypothetical protein [Micromonospora aurantiaca (nom. illeg.)]|uniref:hypothetical protein n=1 Tax=Micromonospora aurantiaca (nom. illeg.) TaxID=47850 RepID=UPI0033C043AE
MGYNDLPEVRQRHAVAVQEMATESMQQLGLVYTPLALADIPGLTDEIGELRRLYLKARGHLRDIVGDKAIEQFGLGHTNPEGLPPRE